MSDPILPLAVWQSGTNENSLPANDNALRLEALSREVLAIANTPSSTNDGDVFIVGDTPAGDFASFDEDDLTIYRGGTWYAWAPVTGIVVNVAGTLYAWDTGWSEIGGGGGQGVTIVTEASTSTMAPATHGGRNKLVRAADDVTFNTSESYAAGDVFNIRATGALSLLETGVTLTPPAGGTLELDAAMAVTVVMTSSSAGDVIGQTVASS